MKYLLILNISIRDKNDRLTSSMSDEYTVDCAPSELLKKISNKKESLDKYYVNGFRGDDVTVVVSLVQVLPLE